MWKHNTASQVRWLRIDPSSDGYPWSHACLHVSGFPTPGMFLNLNEAGLFSAEEGFDALIRAVLFSALVMSEADPELANSRTSQARRLRQDVRQKVWNDWNLALYWASNENLCCGVHPEKPGGVGRTRVVDHVMDKRGRGICWAPCHANNYELMGRGFSPRRTIMATGELIPGAFGVHWPLLWIPAFSREALASSIPKIVVEKWHDGTSCMNPPRDVFHLGIQDPVALPGMPSLIDV